MRAASALVVCTVLFAGCSVVEGMISSGEGTLDPSTIYLGLFDQVETTRREAEQYACLNGAPLMCEVLGITVECECRY